MDMVYVKSLDSFGIKSNMFCKYLSVFSTVCMTYLFELLSLDFNT